MLMHKTPGKRKRHANESGQAAVFLVLAMGIFLIGSMGFVVDGTNLWFHRQAAQTAADAACTAGAMNMLSVAAGANPPTPDWIGTSFQCSGSSGTGSGSVPNSGFAPCQYAALNGYSSSGLKANQAGSDVSVSFPGSFGSIPSCSSSTTVCNAEDIAANPYMQVNVTDRVQTTFIGMLSGGHTVDVGAQASCGLSNVLSSIPVVVLNPNAAKSELTSITSTLFASNPTNLTILDGPQKSVQVNSSDSNAVSTSSLTIDLSKANQGNGGDFAVAAREAEPNNANINFGGGQWVEAAGIISDPFASIAAPKKSALNDCSSGACVTYADTTSNYGCPDLIDGCDVYSGGIYPNGITIQRNQPPGATGLAVFLPGTYYLGGNFSADSDSCLRPAYAVSKSSAAGDGSGGVMFYFSGDATLQVTRDSGALKRPRHSGTRFDCENATWAVPLSEAACAGSKLDLPAGVTGFTGNVLLGPCTGTYTDVFDKAQIKGDPLGTGDPVGEQRGMLFFQDRDSRPTNSPTWNAHGSFAIIGNLYFHYCNSTSPGRGANCNPAAFSDVFNLGNGDDAYVVGDIVVDQLQFGEPSNKGTIKISLNPSLQYHTLKASLLQ